MSAGSASLCRLTAEEETEEVGDTCWTSEGLQGPRRVELRGRLSVQVQEAPVDPQHEQNIVLPPPVRPPKVPAVLRVDMIRDDG